MRKRMNNASHMLVITTHHKTTAFTLSMRLLYDSAGRYPRVNSSSSHTPSKIQEFKNKAVLVMHQDNKPEHICHTRNSVFTLYKSSLLVSRIAEFERQWIAIFSISKSCNFFRWNRLKIHRLSASVLPLDHHYLLCGVWCVCICVRAHMRCWGLNTELCTC